MIDRRRRYEAERGTNGGKMRLHMRENYRENCKQ